VSVPVRLLLDEHVPRVLSTTLESNGYRVERVDEALGEGTPDEEVLTWCAENDRPLVTNDRKDFSALGTERTHPGVLIYTGQLWAREHPSEVVRVIDEVISAYSENGIRNQVVWLDQWTHLV
jgi:predicted nuclease of predicted toxin-antitoxin system